MSTIVTRAGKGSPLTHDEVDANFNNLNTGKAEKTVSNTFTANQIVSVTDNTNAALRITQLGTGNALLVEDSTNPDSTPFVIDAIGKVIVGNTAYITPVTGITPQIQVQGNNASTSSITAARFSADLGSSNYIFSKSRNTTVGTYGGIVSSGDILGNISFVADDGANPILSAQISASVDGTPGTNDMPGRLVFSTTADGASSPTERMRIDSAGNVGIGGTAGTDTKFQLLGTYPTSGTNTFVQQLSGTSPSGTTNVLSGYRARLNTQAAAFALSNLRIFDSGQGTIGATSSVTNQYGYWADASLTGATNNYGFYGNIASGTGRWNLYMAGTAANYFSGDLTVYGGTAIPAGGTAGSGYKLSSTANFGVFFGSGAPTLSAAKGSLYLRSDGTTINDRMYVNTDGSTTWTAVITAA